MTVKNAFTASDRRAWLAVLAHAPRDALEPFAAVVDSDGFEWLRPPEVGLTMIRARIGNRGDRFNLGEVTVTRCIVRHRGGMGTVTAGIGYVLGRDSERATWVARFDALLQQPGQHEVWMRTVIDPLHFAITRARALEAARTAASRVQFCTLQTEACA
jgi:alpha-D-ribose 1-methylphosphonate 5-triphosphate synthase subunit PhnG